MRELPTHNFTVVGLSFLVALLLAVFPIPQSWDWFRPAFVALLVIYWVLALPQQIGVRAAFAVGLIQDIVTFSVPGQHALSLVAVAYVCVLAYRRILNYALWQQSLWVFILVGLHQLFWNWIHNFSGNAAESLIFLVPALVSALIWPFVLVLMEWVRIRTNTRSYPPY